MRVNHTMLNSALGMTILYFQDGVALLASGVDDCSPNPEVVGVYSEDGGNVALGMVAYRQGLVGRMLRLMRGGVRPSLF